MWDSVDTERVRGACDPAASADLAVLLITVLPSPIRSRAAPSRIPHLPVGSPLMVMLSMAILLIAMQRFLKMKIDQHLNQHLTLFLRYQE